MSISEQVTNDSVDDYFNGKVIQYTDARKFATEYDDAIRRLNPNKWVGIFGEKVVAVGNSRSDVVYGIEEGGYDSSMAYIKFFHRKNINLSQGNTR